MSSSMSLSTAFHKNNSNNNIKDISDTKNVNDTMEVGALNQKSASAGVTHSWNRSLLHFNVYNQLQQHLQQQGQQHQTISTPSSPLNTAFSHNALSNKDSEDDVSLHMNTLEAKSSKPMDLNRVSSGSGKDQARTIKKESLKEQKKNYKCEKKRATNELLSTLQDPSIAMLSDWLKVRGSLKSWTKLWCVLKPGMLELYKSCKVKSSHWVATCLLSSCEVIERPSKKDGFCFKLFHHLDQSIWATKGPKGESIGALTLPLPTSYLIFRASSEASGRCWIDALEMALHCSGLLIRSMTKEAKEGMANDTTPPSHAPPSGEDKDFEACDSDYEKHFKICETDEKEEELKFDSEDDEEEDDEDYQKRKKGRIKTPTNSENGNSPPVESSYGENVVEELGQSGAAFQTEEVADENRSIIWTLVKQVRPGMDLSKVALPTFILEPRSFLDKLSDYYYHADLLSEAVCLDDPYSRMKMVVRWYLSGFYKKPKGLKKPYNPVLGETFRCFWKHHKTSSRTFYIAEQISHHPPVSAFYVTNRQDGFSITGSILAKSKFYGNSLSAILDGVCRLVMLNRGEEYTLTMPYAHCKGILLGTLSMEFGGEVSIQCEKTGYKTELEFKLKPFLGSEEASNKVAGKIKLGNEVLASIDGHWDQEMFIRDKRTMKSETFWNPTLEVKGRRLKRYTILPEAQSEFESEKLWSHVSEAILKGDQRAATDEKCFLEDEQRKNARERKARMLEWTPNLFERNLLTGDWVYKFADWRPWDPLNDVLQFEKDFVISTKTHHQTPIVHTTSITSMEENPLKSKLSHSRNPSLDCATRIHRMKMRSLHTPGSMQGTTPSCQDMPGQHNNDVEGDSESSISPAEISGSMGGGLNKKPKWNKEGGQKSKLASLLVMQQENNEKLSSMQQQLTSLQTQIASASSHCNPQSEGSLFESRAVLFLLVAILLHSFFQAWLK